MQHLQFFFIFAECRQSGPTVVCRSDARDALLIFFGLVPGWRVFFPHTGGVFSLFTSPFALEGVAGLGLWGIIIPNFCLAWRHLNQASSSTGALDFGSACWACGESSNVWSGSIDMVKNQTHSQFPEGIRIHRIISPNRADELPIERWTPSRNMCFWLCKSIKTSGCKPSLRP